MLRPLQLRILSVLLASLIATSAPALVNPALQPGDVAERHRVVAAGAVTAVDETARTVTIDIAAVLQGDLATKRLVIAVPLAKAGGDGAEAAGGQGGSDLFHDATVGDQVVLFLGKSGPHGNPLAGLIYHDEWFHELAGDAKDPAAWTWKGNTGDKMWGCFNGDAGRLAEMLADAKAGRSFFPALPFNRFKPELVLGAYAAPLRGVALADLDGDGRLDAVAVSESGCHVFMQRKAMELTDCTAALGLTEVKSWSVSAADTDGDSRIDLLLDGRLYLNTPRGFVLSDRLPAAAAKDVKVSAFVELNGDGHPDVLVSRVGGGLAVWLNSGAKGGPFIEATAAMGLDRRECGAGSTGFVAPGDWDGDGRTDLFYSAGKGLLLVQDAKGVFQPQPIGGSLSFKLSDGSDQEGFTGGASFAGLWNPGSTDIAIPGDLGLSLLQNVAGKPMDRAGTGNESHLSRQSQLAVLAEDLNCDGNIDLYTLTRKVDSKNSFHTNRGYGSYMMDDLYAQDEAFPGTSYTTGQWGAVAADVDGDGAPDLLLGGIDGRLRLLLNDTLNHRAVGESSRAQDRALARTAILAVDVAGTRAVVGARLTVRHPDGRIAGWRRLGDQVLTGCGPAAQARFAVREPGPVTLEVHWADGHEQKQTVNLVPGAVEKLRLEAK